MTDSCTEQLITSEGPIVIAVSISISRYPHCSIRFQIALSVPPRGQVQSPQGSHFSLFFSLFLIDFSLASKTYFFSQSLRFLAIFSRQSTDFGSILGSPGAFFSNFSEKSKTLRNHIYICFRKGRDLQISTKNRPKRAKST